MNSRHIDQRTLRTYIRYTYHGATLLFLRRFSPRPLPPRPRSRVSPPIRLPFPLFSTPPPSVFSPRSRHHHRHRSSNKFFIAAPDQPPIFFFFFFLFLFLLFLLFLSLFLSILPPVSRLPPPLRHLTLFDPRSFFSSSSSFSLDPRVIFERVKRSPWIPCVLSPISVIQKRFYFPPPLFLFLLLLVFVLSLKFLSFFFFLFFVSFFQRKRFYVGREIGVLEREGITLFRWWTIDASCVSIFASREGFSRSYGRAVFLVNGLSFRGTRSIGRKIEAEFGIGGRVIKNR